ncbi:MAG: hypothetical protein ACTHMV_13625 [Chitinophagaceae bacterium]
MRAFKMHEHWKPGNIAVTVIGTIGGFISYIRSMPMISISSELLGLMKACVSALIIAACAAMGKKIGEEYWPSLKKFFYKQFKK